MQQDIRQSSSGDLACFGFLFIILAAAMLLRAYDLDRTSLWYDEAATWSQSTRSFSEMLSAVAQDNYPPLHNIILWLSIPISGDSEVALRLPSVLLGVAAVWLIYFAGSFLGGRSAGLLAAALLAVSPFHIWYSTEARMYALLAASGLAFLLSVFKVLERPSGIRLLALGLSGALFLYSHVYALLGFAAVGLVCAFYALADLVRTRTVLKSSALAACLAMGVSLILFVPWLIILAIRIRSVAATDFWIAYPGAEFLKNMAASMSGSLALFWILAGMALLYVLRPLAGSFLASVTAIRTSRRATVVCLAYTAGPLVLAYLYSVFVQPILFDRYLIAAWTGLLVLASAGANMIVPRVGPAVLFVVALLLCYPELKFALLHKTRPEWRSIVQDYQAARSPDDRLILYKGFAAPALAYYLREPGAFKAAESIEDLNSPPRLPNDRWLLLVHSGPPEINDALEAFGADGTDPVAQRFGWGASGLSLFRSDQR